LERVNDGLALANEGASNTAKRDNPDVKGKAQGGISRRGRKRGEREKEKRTRHIYWEKGDRDN